MAVALKILKGDLGVVPAVIEIKRRHVPHPLSEIRRERKFRELRPPEGRRDEEQACERGPAYGLRQVFQKDRSSERVTHENGLSSAHDQFVNSPWPGPVAGVCGPGHARCPHSIAWSQGIPD